MFIYAFVWWLDPRPWSDAQILLTILGYWYMISRWHLNFNCITSVLSPRVCYWMPCENLHGNLIPQRCVRTYLKLRYYHCWPDLTWDRTENIYSLCFLVKISLLPCCSTYPSYTGIAVVCVAPLSRTNPVARLFANLWCSGQGNA